MSIDFTFKDKYDINDLRRIMTILRQPGGCPWDREQTHESIRANFIEEVYEACEAIDRGDPDMLREELGDVLMQIVFHSEMERERGSFDFDGVTDAVCKKLIYRHPHVFGDVVAETPEEVLRNWDELKKKEKGQTGLMDTVNAVPRQFPALVRAQKVQKRAAKGGYEFPDVSYVIDKVKEETREVEQVMGSADKARIEDEIGDLLFSVVNLARKLGVDSEEALTFATDKFTRRVTETERICADRGVSVSQMSVGEFDEVWAEAKKSQK